MFTSDAILLGMRQRRWYDIAECWLRLIQGKARPSFPFYLIPHEEREW
jgi:hypothetical protein